jgi:zinc ribbon protein
MSFCVHCGAQLAQGALFCVSCGRETPPGALPPAPPVLTGSPKHGQRMIAIAIGTALVVAAAILWVTLGSHGRQGGTTPSADVGSCIGGTWRVDSDLSTRSIGANTRLTSRIVREYEEYRSDGTFLLNLTDALQRLSSNDNTQAEVTFSGSITYHYVVDGATVTYSDGHADGSYTMTIDGQPPDQGGSRGLEDYLIAKPFEETVICTSEHLSAHGQTVDSDATTTWQTELSRDQPN